MRTHAPASKSASTRTDVSAPALHPAFAPARRLREADGAGHDFARVAVSAPPSPSAPIQRQDDDKPLEDKLPKHYGAKLAATAGLSYILGRQRRAVHHFGGPKAHGFQTSFDGIFQNLHRFWRAPRPIKLAGGILATGGAALSHFSTPIDEEHAQAREAVRSHLLGKYFGKQEE